MTPSISRLKPIRLLAAAAVLPFAFWGCAQFQASQQSATPTTSETKVAEQVPAPPQAAEPAVNVTFDKEAITKIRDEGLNRSQVMATLSYLSDVIGPRLTGSPNLHHANEWTRDKLSGWGLENAHLEAWGPFGRGWAVKRFSAEVVEPQSISLIAAPKAWSGGFDQPITAEVVLLEPKDANKLDELAGKLEGKIVLLGSERAVTPHFAADGSRLSDEELQQLSEMRGNIGFPVPTVLRQRREAATRQAPNGELLQNGQAAARGGGRGGRGATSNPAVANNVLTTLFNFAAKEKAALICTPGGAPFDFGTMAVQSANVPGPTGGRGFAGPTTRAWTSNTPTILPQVTISVEQYNRLVRIIHAGEKVTMAVNLQVQYYNDDPMAYNTIAEIPGTDLKDQIVMLGGHMDSWTSGTGATDNGAGVAVAMEAVRIIKALDLKPRRTIRIALWSGEEEGLYGSAAYVRQHFGSVAGGGRGGRRGGGGTPPRLTPGPEYEKLSVYFNLDNGTGKIRGVYCQSNSTVMSIFKAWLAPFADLGATTVTLGNTDSTDHISFANVGLPAFQFIQDDIEYFTRTHHTNEDVFDRIQADDVKQASVIMASFVYNAAMMDHRMPRASVMTPSTVPGDQPASAGG